jgi:hypothetical protein
MLFSPCYACHGTRWPGIQVKGSQHHQPLLVLWCKSEQHASEQTCPLTTTQRAAMECKATTAGWHAACNFASIALAPPTCCLNMVATCNRVACILAHTGRLAPSIFAYLSRKCSKLDTRCPLATLTGPNLWRQGQIRTEHRRNCLRKQQANRAKSMRGKIRAGEILRTQPPPI